MPRVKTSHTLSPVPFCIFNAELLGRPLNLRSDIANAGLANVAATVLNLAGFQAPSDYEASLIEFDTNEQSSTGTSQNQIKSSNTKNNQVHSPLHHPKLKTNVGLSSHRDLYNLGLRSVLLQKLLLR